jgi:cytochrome P450
VATLAQWLRKVGCLIAMATPAPPPFEENGIRLGKELSDFLLTQAKRTTAAGPNRFVSVMANLCGTDLGRPEDMARSVGVLMLAGTTTVKAITLALHELLLRPEERLRVIYAARRGAEAEVHQYTLEALRFRPVFPMLLRYSPRDAVVAAHTEHAARIPAGATVIVSPMTAMFDPEVVECPKQFVPGRPKDVYLHFGHETQHTCIGKYLAQTAMRVVLTHLFAERHMHAGSIAYDGAAIAGYVIEQSRNPASAQSIPSDHSAAPPSPSLGFDKRSPAA